MTSRRQLLAAGSLLWLGRYQTADSAPPQPEAPNALPVASNLEVDARDAVEAGVPLLLLYSLPGCPYCESVRRAFLLPLQAESPPRARIRQVDVDSARELKDFQGRAQSHRSFAITEGITLTPVVAFYGVGGQQFAERLVGSMLADFYPSYLDAALSQAATLIRSSKAR
jgi:glutaredoxin